MGQIMQKLFNNCYALDTKCYEKYALTEDILMEHAASSIENFIRSKFNKKSTILIACGAGNNGADGITLARLLHPDYDVKLYIPFGLKSTMAKLQLNRTSLVGVELVEEICSCDIVVDALFGAGLNRELNSQTVAIINDLNALKAYKIACDIPSGIDESGVANPTAFVADTTITMGALKEALYSDLAKDFVGIVELANLGISRELYEDDSSTFLLDSGDFTPPIRKAKNCHKGSFGHASIFCGEKEGAAIISATAAARFGAGLTTLVVHEKVNCPPFLMSSTTTPKNATAIAIGMGLGNFFEEELLNKEVINSTTPIVLDADALYKKELLNIIKQNREVVITPHPKEFAAILKLLKNIDVSVEQVQKNRFKLAREFSSKFPNVVLLLKGANTIIAKNAKLYVNPLGSSVLAKGGSGDVLSGLIVSLLAQGYSALDSAINGSLALAIASQKFDKPNYYLLPTDIIELLAKITYAE